MLKIRDMRASRRCLILPVGSGVLKVSGSYLARPGYGLAVTGFQIWGHLSKFRRLVRRTGASAVQPAHVRTSGLLPEVLGLSLPVWVMLMSHPECSVTSA